jgi:uncharacterized membrane protein YphA (DoxX/SURF4 family)
MIYRTRPLVFLHGLARIGLGTAFLVAGFSKTQQPYDFLIAVHNYELIGPWAGLLLAQVLPFLEIALGLSLVLGVFQGGATVLASLLLGVFVAGQLVVLSRGAKMPCGCVSLDSEPIDAGTVIRTGSLFVLCLLCACASRFALPISNNKDARGEIAMGAGAAELEASKPG